jgi:hypothetical protein
MDQKYKKREIPHNKLKKINAFQWEIKLNQIINVFNSSKITVEESVIELIQMSLRYTKLYTLSYMPHLLLSVLPQDSKKAT